MRQRDAIDPSHAFYLGYEMAKATIALTLGKNYTQDEALRWGFLTVPEESHRGAGFLPRERFEQHRLRDSHERATAHPGRAHGQADDEAGDGNVDLEMHL